MCKINLSFLYSLLDIVKLKCTRYLTVSTNTASRSTGKWEERAEMIKERRNRHKIRRDLSRMMMKYDALVYIVRACVIKRQFCSSQSNLVTDGYNYGGLRNSLKLFLQLMEER